MHLDDDKESGARAPGKMVAAALGNPATVVYGTGEKINSPSGSFTVTRGRTWPLPGHVGPIYWPPFTMTGG
jgi:hypothetical protein